MAALFGGLRPNGTLLVVGASMDPIAVPAAMLIGGSKTITGHASGTARDSEDTLNFSVLSGVRPMIETMPLESAAAGLREDDERRRALPYGAEHRRGLTQGPRRRPHLMRLSPDRPLGVAPATILDYRELARRRLPRQLFDYIDGGAYEEATLRANVADLQRILLRQVVMRDVSTRTQEVQVLGQRLAFPVVLGPVGLGGMFARRAEVQAARAAHSAGIPFVESTVSICGLEEVAGATPAPPWFQLYVMRDRRYAEDLMARAHAAGAPVLVLTVDLAVVGARHRDVRNGMGPRPAALGAAAHGGRSALPSGMGPRRAGRRASVDLRQPRACRARRSDPGGVSQMGRCAI